MYLFTSKPSTRSQSKSQHPQKGPQITFLTGSPLHSPAYTVSATVAASLLLKHNKHTPAPGPLHLFFSVLTTPPPYISMDHSFISFRSLFQKGHPTESATPTSLAYSLMLSGFVFLFGQEDEGGEAGRTINTSVAQQRGPAWTCNDIEPAPEKYNTVNPAHLILSKDDTSAVKRNVFL